MNRQIRIVSLSSVALTSIALLAAACTGSKKSETTDPRCADTVVVYEGAATDETCKTILEAEDAGLVTTGGTFAPTITLGSGALASASTSFHITWNSPIDLDGDAFLYVPAKRHAPKKVELAGEMLKLLSPVSVAFAHEPPVTGAVHMLRIKGIGGSDTQLLFTTKLQTMITGSNLAAILATATPMQLELTDTYLTENRIATPAQDGPFRAPVVSFHVQ